MNTNTTNNSAHRFLAEDIANIFYSEDNGHQEWSRGSISYWNHVYAIEDIITHSVQGNDLTLDNGG